LDEQADWIEADAGRAGRQKGCRVACSRDPDIAEGEFRAAPTPARIEGGEIEHESEFCVDPRPQVVFIRGQLAQHELRSADREHDERAGDRHRDQCAFQCRAKPRPHGGYISTTSN
jgi:hypothetical protein